MKFLKKIYDYYLNKNSFSLVTFNILRNIDLLLWANRLIFRKSGLKRKLFSKFRRINEN